MKSGCRVIRDHLVCAPCEVSDHTLVHCVVPVCGHCEDQLVFIRCKDHLVSAPCEASDHKPVTLLYPVPLLSVGRLTMWPLTWSKYTTWWRSMTYMYHVTTDQVFMHKISAHKYISSMMHQLITCWRGTWTHWPGSTPCPPNISQSHKTSADQINPSTTTWPLFWQHVTKRPNIRRVNAVQEGEEIHQVLYILNIERSGPQRYNLSGLYIFLNPIN